MTQNVTAFILAGGRSSRMGIDKAFLRLGGITLLEHTIATAKLVCEKVVLVGDRSKLDAYGTVIEDVFRSRGPLGGIHAALNSAAADDFNLLLAVDTPVIPGSFLEKLLKIAQESGAIVTVPRTNGRLQPLCAVYRREFASTAEKSLHDGHNKIDPLFTTVTTRVLDEDEIKLLGFDIDIFDNVNTPEDWQRIQQRFGINRG